MQVVPKRLYALFFLCALLTLHHRAIAQYQITTIQPSGGVFTIPYGENDQGVITGFYYPATFVSSGFVRAANGTILTPTFPFGSVGTQLAGINNSGIAVGSYLDTSNVSHGATYATAADIWTKLPDITNTVGNLPTGITNANLITGVAVGGYDLNGQPVNSQGYFYDGSNYTLFDAPGADRTYAGTIPEDINDSGTVVGFFSPTGANGLLSGFIRDSSGAYTTLDYPGADSTFIEGINNQGVVAGSYETNGVSHSFLWSSVNGFTRFDVPGGLNTEIWGLDNHGNLVGNYIDPQQGIIFGFLATPVPEPGALALLLGLTMPGVRALLRRRKR